MTSSNSTENGNTWVAGWGVFRNAPWHFIGLYPTENEAKAIQITHGDGYEVQYGKNESGTDNFVHSSKAL